MSHPLRAFVLLLSFCFVLVGCGTDDEEGPSPTSSVEQTPAKPSAAPPEAPSLAPAETKPQVRANKKLAELKDLIPEDLPLYPDAYNGFLAENTGNDVVVVMEVGGGVADAVDYYVDAIVDKGWAIESETLAETNGEIIAYKGDRQMFVLTVTNGQETLISVKVRPTPK